MYVQHFQVPELRKLCKEHGLTSTGKKEELLNRLKEALLEGEGYYCFSFSFFRMSSNLYVLSKLA